jgi:hypothetical protein
VFISSIIAARVVDFHDHVGHATNTIPLVFLVRVLKISGNHKSSIVGIFSSKSLATIILCHL